MPRQPHQRVAVGGHKADLVFANFLHEKACVLLVHRGASAEHALDAGLDEILPFGHRFEQLGRGEERAHAAILKNGGGLIDHMIHVATRLIKLL